MSSLKKVFKNRILEENGAEKNMFWMNRLWVAFQRSYLSLAVKEECERAKKKKKKGGSYSESNQPIPRWCSGKDCTDVVGDSGDSGLVPGLGKPLGEGNGKPLQYSCLENSMDRVAWWAAVH